MRTFVLFAGAAALAFSAAAASAQGSAKSKTSPARTAISIECAKQADAKGLHGKARRSFRSRCKRDLAKKG